MASVVSAGDREEERTARTVTLDAITAGHLEPTSPSSFTPPSLTLCTAFESNRCFIVIVSPGLTRIFPCSIQLASLLSCKTVTSLRCLVEVRERIHGGTVSRRGPYDSCGNLFK